MEPIDNREEIVVDDDKLLEELEELDDEENKPVEEVDEEIKVDEVKKEEVKVEPEKPKVDYEAKFKASSQEAMVMKAKLDEIEAEKNKPVVIDDTYMKSNYPDWEDMTTTEQRLAKGLEETKQANKELTAKTNEYNNDRRWRDQIDETVDDLEFIEKYPAIKNKTEEFKRFCTKPSRKGVDMDVLTSAFLFEYKEPEKELRTIFKNTDGGHDKVDPKRGLTLEESQVLRKASNSKFMDKLKDPKYDPLADL